MAEITKPEKQPRAERAKRIAALAGTGATDDEIAIQMDLSVEKLRRQFGRALRRARATLKVRLRARQTSLALQEKGSERMLLWLGRQYLGQTESPSGPDSSAEDGKVYIGVRIKDI